MNTSRSTTSAPTSSTPASDTSLWSSSSAVRTSPAYTYGGEERPAAPLDREEDPDLQAIFSPVGVTRSKSHV